MSRQIFRASFKMSISITLKHSLVPFFVQKLQNTDELNLKSEIMPSDKS